MQIVSIGENLREMSKPVFWEKNKKIVQYVVWWKFYPWQFRPTINKCDKWFINIFWLNEVKKH